MSPLGSCTAHSERAGEPDSTVLNHYRRAQESIKGNDLNGTLHNYYLFLRHAQGRPETYAKQLITAYIDIGNSFVVHSAFTWATGCYEKGLSLSEAYSEAREQMLSMLGLCQTYLYMGDTLQARCCNERLLRLDGVPRPDRLNLYYLNRATDLMLHNHTDSAIAYYKRGIALIDRHHLDQAGKFNSLLSLSKCYTTQSQIDSALHYAHLALDNAACSDIKATRQLIAMRSLARLYTRQGDAERAAHYLTLCYNLRDSVENLRDFLAIKSQQEQFEQAQSDAAVRRLAHSNTRMERLLLIGLAVVLLLLAFAYYVLRQKRKTDLNYQALFQRNKELLQIEREYKQRLLLASQPQAAADQAQPPSPASAAHDLDQVLWQRILAVMDSLDELCSPDFGLVRLTALVESNTTYVSQTVKAATGKNVPAFVNERRIREACRRLLDSAQYGNLTLQAIAESVGFTSQSTFNRAFKQTTGLTPVVYRRLSNQQSADQATDPAE